MIRDLRLILDGWNYEPGKISVRKIVGRDGREKIQTRIDLGLLQLEPNGRPDGTRPHERGSLLEHHEHRLAEHARGQGSDAGFTLSADDCRDLRHEAYLFYQRYLSLFVLEEFEGVERDTAHNLRLTELVTRYGQGRDREALDAQRAYVMMMHTRAKAYQSLAAGQADTALQLVELGMGRIHALATEEEGREAPRDVTGELTVLAQLREEIVQQLPPDAPVRLRRELRAAIQEEDYEKAAQLRDRLQAQQPRRATG